MKFKEISIYPSIKKDIAIMIDKDISSDEISKVIKKAGGNLLVAQEIFDVYTNAVLGNKKSIAYSLTFGSNTKTLSDDEIKKLESMLKKRVKEILDEMIASLKENNSDFIGIGKYLYQNDYKYYNKNNNKNNI